MVTNAQEERQRAREDYRTGPGPGPIVRIAIRRSRTVLVILLVAAASSGLFAYLFSGGERLVCSRERCTLSTWHLAETVATKETIPLADIQRAELARGMMEDTSHRKTETYAIALVVAGKQRILGGGYTNTEREEKQSFIDQVNAFLNGNAPTLDIERDHPTIGITWLVVFGLLFGLYSFMATTIEIDRGRQLVTIRRTRSSIWSRELPLQSVTDAFIKAVGSKGSRALALRLADGAPIQLTVGEVYWRDRFDMGRDAINSALQAARNDI